MKKDQALAYRVFDVRCGGIISRHKCASAAMIKQRKASAVWAVAGPGESIILKALVPAGEISGIQRVAFGDYIAVMH
jgi:hypothetical protein